MKTTILTKNFTLEELTRTSTGLYNQPRNWEIANLKLLCFNVLQPLRDYMQEPIIIDSGYRSDAVNSKVHGNRTSQHLIGRAADFRCGDMNNAFNFIRQKLVFDQLIWEFGNDTQPSWIHVSFAALNNREEVLRSKKILGMTIYKVLQ